MYVQCFMSCIQHFINNISFPSVELIVVMHMYKPLINSILVGDKELVQALVLDGEITRIFTDEKSRWEIICMLSVSLSIEGECSPKIRHIKQ